MASFKLATDKAFKAEGGFQQDKADTANYVGGKLIGTNRGISAIAYKGFYKKTPTVADMKNLTADQAKAIYKKNYWDKIRGDEINNQSVADMMFQYVIGTGAGAVKQLKVVANATKGKKIFAETTTPFTSAEIKLINELPQSGYHKNLKTYRAGFFKRIVEKTPSKAKFLKGWLKRLDTHVYSGAVSPTPFTLLPFGVNKKVLIGTGLALLTGLAVYEYQTGKVSKGIKRLRLAA